MDYLSNINKSPRNKTISVQSEEIPSLMKYIKPSFTEDSHCIINGDIFEVLSSVPDNYFDLLIIDPPYNMDKDFGTCKFKVMQPEAYKEYIRSWLGPCCAKLKDSGSLYMCGDWKCSGLMQQVLEEYLVVINRITWQREKGRGSKKNWKNGMEDIWLAVKNPNDYYFDVEAVKMKRKVLAPYKVDGNPKDWNETEDGNYRLSYPSNFWDDITIPFWSMPENTTHPTQKPEKLYAKLILASCPPGGTILDPFAGSGTAVVTAKKLGRKCVGIELNEEYCLFGAKRLALAEESSEIQGYRDGIFWERNSAPK